MTNTQKRVISAMVLAVIVFSCGIQGSKALLVLILIVGMICVDEFYCNFFKKSRKDFNYSLSHLLLVVPFLYFNFVTFAPAFIDVFVNAGLVLDFFLLIYLFKVKMDSKIIIEEIGQHYSFLVGIFFLLPLMSLASLLHYVSWIYLICVLLLVNFGMDIGAWFFGKNFGKHKLWQSVSPNKTIEGLFGGMFISSIIGSLLWWFFFDRIGVAMVIFFGFAGGVSQLGDLVQSKMKRQCEIKDSSSLIPGHGGLYDRIDSLVFLSPVFATALRYIYF